MSNFGNELSLLRKRANITQYQLAKELNLSRSYIFRFETGERNPNLETLKKIFDILKLSKYDQIKLLLLSNNEFELDSNKNTFKICLNLALELKNKGLIKEAKLIIEKAMIVFDNMIELHALLANLNLLNNDYSSAINANEDTLKYLNEIPAKDRDKIGISEAEITHNLGYVYFERGLNNNFQKDYLITKNWESKDNLISKTITDLEDEIIGDFKIAIEKIEFANSLEPDNLHIIDQLARLYYYMGDLNKNLEERNILFDKSIYFYDNVISSDDNTFEFFKKQEASIFIALILGKKLNLIESSRLINTIINHKPLYYLSYLVKSCIYSINGENNKQYLDIAYNSLVQAIKLNNNLKEEIKLEVDLFNLRFNSDFTNKFNDLYSIEEGQENET